MKKQAGIATEREPNIGISSKNRMASIGILHKILADEFVLYMQTLNYHWNLIGPQFNDYHKLLDEQYRMLQEMLDEIAERVRAVGGIAPGSLQEMLEHTQLKENGGNIPQPKKMIENLLENHETIIQSIRKGITTTAEHYRDIGTSDFLTGLIRQHEKTAWMLRSLLER